MIRGESSAYWTVFDGAYEPVAVADAYLRRVRFSSGKALGTTRVYASNLALFSAFCLASGRSLRRAALEFDRFVHEIDRVGFLIGRIREAMGELAPGERAELQELLTAERTNRSAILERLPARHELNVLNVSATFDGVAG